MSDVLWILGAGAAVLVGVGQATVHVYRVWSRRRAVNVAAESEDYRLQLVEREEMEEVSEPDSLRCDHFDCVRCLGHDGLHESPWGDSVPWPPEADLDYDDDPFVSDSHLRYNAPSVHSANLGMLAALEDAYWCSAHNTTRMACKDKPHQSSGGGEPDAPHASPEPSAGTLSPRLEKGPW